MYCCPESLKKKRQTNITAFKETHDSGCKAKLKFHICRSLFLVNIYISVKEKKKKKPIQSLKMTSQVPTEKETFGYLTVDMSHCKETTCNLPATFSREWY